MNVIKNTQKPLWDYQAEFNVPDGNQRTFHGEVFDSEKVRKDKSRGKLDLDITDVLSKHGQEGKWFPLAGVKSRKTLRPADFLDDLARNARDILPMEIERIINNHETFTSVVLRWIGNDIRVLENERIANSLRSVQEQLNQFDIHKNADRPLKVVKGDNLEISLILQSMIDEIAARQDQLNTNCFPGKI